MAENKAPLNFTPDRQKGELTVERLFDAPRELVWQAWTEPERLASWWGPQGWTTTNYQLDLNPGGVWFYCMRGPDGLESWGKAIYREVVAPERLVYLDRFADKDGNVVESMPQMLITNEFTEEGGKTRLTSRTKFASPEDLEAVLAMGVIQGVTETWDRLADYLAGV
jgi:uncharacterized protein YndB with AHSA1/START domain